MFEHQDAICRCQCDRTARSTFAASTSKLITALTRRGARYNGTTSQDRTNYFETLPASDDNLVLVAQAGIPSSGTPTSSPPLAPHWQPGTALTQAQHKRRWLPYLWQQLHQDEPFLLLEEEFRGRDLPLQK